MKPYNERLPLIDEAIDELNGELPTLGSVSADNLLLCITTTGKAEEGSYVRGYSSRPNGNYWIFICTTEEFEQRVKEREAMKVIDYYRENYDWEYKEDGSCTLTPKIVTKNDWYEKGERPPVGEIVTWKEECKALVVANCKKYLQSCVRMENGEVIITNDALLRPLRKEEDELVERMTDLLIKHKFEDDLGELAEIIVKDEGWRPTEKKDD